MKFLSLKAFQKHLRDAAPSHLADFYVILSKDEHTTKMALDYLLEVSLPKNTPKELSIKTLFSGRVSLEELLGELVTLSFLTEKRTILLKDVEKLTKQQMQILKDAFSHPSPTFRLVLIGTSLPRDGVFYKSLEKVACLLDLTDQKPWDKEKETIEWMQTYLKSSGKLINPELLSRVVKAVGSDLAFLKNEMDKLITYIGKKQEITKEDLLAIGAIRAHYTPWQLSSAIFNQNSKEALKISHSLLQDNASLIGLLRQLRNQFHMRCMMATLLEEGKGVPDILAAFPTMKPRTLDQSMREAKKFGRKRLEEALLLIEAFEFKAKNEKIEDRLVIECLIASIAII